MKLLILALTLLSTTAFARGGSGAGNGGGIGENNVTFAHAHMERFIDFCLASSFCRVTPEETTLLTRIKASMEKERATQLKFVARRDNKRFFWLDGQVRIAKTGSEVGNPIYFNVDLLYRPIGNGRFQPIDVPLAASILIHELGHHHGVKDHAALDALGTKVQSVLMRQVLRTEIWNGDVTFDVIQMNVVLKDDDKQRIKEIDQLLISYRDEVMNITQKVVDAIRCPVAGDKVVALRMYNLHALRGPTYDDVTRLTSVPLRAWYALRCTSTQRTEMGNIEMALALKRLPETNQPDFVVEKSSFSETSCRQDPNACD